MIPPRGAQLQMNLPRQTSLCSRLDLQSLCLFKGVHRVLGPLRLVSPRLLARRNGVQLLMTEFIKEDSPFSKCRPGRFVTVCRRLVAASRV